MTQERGMVYVRAGRITAEFELFAHNLADIMVGEIVNMRTINTKFVYMWVFFVMEPARGGVWVDRVRSTPRF